MTTTKFYTADSKYATEIFRGKDKVICFDIVDAEENDSSYMPFLMFPIKDIKKMIEILKELAEVEEDNG